MKNKISSWYLELIIILLFIILLITVVSYDGNILPPDIKPIYSHNRATDKRSPKIAIIIDDFGENRNGVKEMMGIDRPITFAVIPFMDYSGQDALNAAKRGHEIIVHLPMQSGSIESSLALGPNPVRMAYTNVEIRRVVQDSIDAIPNAVGVNIHMGARSSEDERIMTCVMQTVGRNGLYFVDSRTSPKTVCRSVAEKVGIRFAERNVFLESPAKTTANIRHQLELAGDMALKNGSAVVIGHVGITGGKITADSIKVMIPQLERKGISFVFASELVQ